MSVATLLDYFMMEDPLDEWCRKNDEVMDSGAWFVCSRHLQRDLESEFSDAADTDSEGEQEEFWDATDCIVRDADSGDASYPIAHALVSALASRDEEDLGDNTSSSFDTDSSFWVCDNSATGHICNDASMFHGDLVPSIYNVATANGTGDASKMGTVILWLMDDEGVEHTFTIKECIYLPSSPVNILSTRRLSEHFSDEAGRPDRKGTGITSLFECHELFWNGRKHKKTFTTAGSGLPECLFNTGFSKFQTYTTKVSRHYDDTVSWAFTSKNKSNLSEGEAINLDVKDAISFLKGMKLLFNDGSGNKALVTFLAVDFVGGMHAKCKVSKEDGTSMLVDPETLNFIENPDIASIPQTSEEYCRECERITPGQIKKILNPQPLSPLQEEMMSHHYRLHHLPFPKLLTLAEKGEIPQRLAKLRGRTPICVACIFGAAHKRPWRSKSKAKNHIRKQSDDHPGSKTSTDQLVSAQPGLIPQMSGRLTALRVNGATIFADHYSDHVYVFLMRDLTLEETLLAKASYEKFLHSIGVTTKAYHADNGRFADKGFRDDCEKNNQTITFCGVGAHHQNGIAERKIKSLTLGGRTLLLHAKRMLPEYISTILWPFAIKCYEDRMNNLTHRADGRTPFETLAGLESSPLRIKDFHTFGCPCYVLDHRLQSGQSMVPKWDPRARMGIYVGRSPSHASSVGLILNPRTGHISPQYHVVYDDDFTTVPYLRSETVPPRWAELVRESSQLYQTDSQTDTWQSLSEDGIPEDGDFGCDSDAFDQRTEHVAQTIESQDTNAESSLALDREGVSAVSNNRVSFQEDENTYTDARQRCSMPEAINLEQSGLRRSSRLAELRRMEEEHPNAPGGTSNRRSVNTTRISKACLVMFSLFCAIGVGTMWSFTLQTTKNISTSTKKTAATLFSNAIDSYHRANSLYDGTINCYSALAMSAGASNEVFTYKQALQEEDYREFVKAMIKEITDHETREHWTLIDRDKIPPGTKTIMSIWSFKRKRHPDGTLNKHKARLCAHGGMQTWGQNYWETYAPVVNWASVRLILAVAKIHNLPSKSIDFVLAFPQAPLEVPVYMELPMGFVPEGEGRRQKYVLRLEVSLYGLKQASYNWFAKLKSGLEDRGFVQSNVDPCVFYSQGCIVLCYVDDCIIIGRTESLIDDLIQSLHGGDENFVFTDEGSIDKYLGVDIRKVDEDSFEMSQPFLIQRITSLLGIDNGRTNKKLTPVGKPLLNKDTDGEPRKYDWSYRGAIGMLTYLTGSVRPDIAMAVHQCARFSINPKRSHEQAVMRIGRYLLSSKDRGIVYKPDSSLGLETYVDADFAGAWDPENAGDADTVYSRTGFVIRYAGCPVLWQSKLQTEIALSTAEAEYIAMSRALRETIPLMNLMREINVIFKLHIPQPKFVLKVHEDNQSCIAMANNPKFTPRTKHIAIKYHHFRKHVKNHSNPNGFIDIVYCPTHDQIADIFTKPTSDDIFWKLRMLLMGW
jgi:hypothetical protein